MCFLLDFALRTLGFWFAVSEVAVFVENQLYGIIFSKGFWGIASPFSTALYVPSGFSDKRFETAPDFSLLKHVKTVLAKR
ncbi:hypothetical protein V3H26_22350 [Vibrio parahaemolyticus]|uniref:hypothetical protein n=1 Tax=Vibrio parahaemolyticus TaxID=670 RepID=UPI003B67C881|nr:hypothetical protein [Vibrio parahaemolyticus]